MNRLAPRIKHHRNGTCTVSGIPSGDLRAILTSAALWRHQQKDENKNDKSLYSVIWERRLRMILDMLKPPPYLSGYENIPAVDLAPHERVIRLRDVKSDRSFSIFIDKVLKDLKKP